jgi:hypothetical protein
VELVDLVKAAASYTTSISVVALGVSLFAYLALRTRERSIRAEMIGDAPLSGADIVKVLKTFADDAGRLRALQAVLGPASSATARDRQQGREAGMSADSGDITPGQPPGTLRPSHRDHGSAPGAHQSDGLALRTGRMTPSHAARAAGKL